MRLTSNGTSFLGDTPHATHREPIDPARVAAVLIARGRHPVIAHVLAHGGYSAALQISAGDARLAGEDLKLFVKEPR